MGDIILKVENVSKQYRLGSFGTNTIGGDIHRWWTTRILGKEDPFLKVGARNDRTSKVKADFIWALKDINFEVKRGEVLGIIGKNGAGKSTLLKLLSRITSPTTGSIESWGRMASLLEVGTGFHPELTGRENIFLNGAILGMSKQEIKRKLDEIIDFSGCALYIDTPVKRYSSGMTVRLGFAVAAFLDPEILIVDEVLAVGDAEFQKKAIGKMQDISKGEGRTILFVSHNMAAIRNLCNKGLLIDNGMVKTAGDIETVVNEYLTLNDYGINANLPYIVNDFLIVCVFNTKQSDSELFVNIKFTLAHDIKDFRIGFKIFNKSGDLVVRSLLTDLDNNKKDFQAGSYEIKTSVDLSFLSEGYYTLALHHSVYGVADYNLEERIFNKFEILRNDRFNLTYINETNISHCLTFNQWIVEKEIV